jgi:hypothetical protein
MRYFYNKNHFWQLQNPHYSAQLKASDWCDFWLGWGFVVMKLIMSANILNRQIPIKVYEKLCSCNFILYSIVSFQQKWCRHTLDQKYSYTCYWYDHNDIMTYHFGIRYSLKPVYFINNIYNGMHFIFVVPCIINLFY